MECIALTEVYLTLHSPLAIGAVAFAVVGIIVTVTVLAVYIRHNDTPIIRASGRELSYVLLVGLLLCYSVTFILIIKPTNFVCAVQQFLIGLCFRLTLPSSVEFKLPLSSAFIGNAELKLKHKNKFLIVQVFPRKFHSSLHG